MVALNSKPAQLLARCMELFPSEDPMYTASGRKIVGTLSKENIAKWKAADALEVSLGEEATMIQATEDILRRVTDRETFSEEAQKQISALVEQLDGEKARIVNEHNSLHGQRWNPIAEQFDLDLAGDTVYSVIRINPDEWLVVEAGTREEAEKRMQRRTLRKLVAELGLPDEMAELPDSM